MIEEEVRDSHRLLLSRGDGFGNMFPHRERF